MIAGHVTSEETVDEAALAADLGRTCALAVRCQRDLQDCAGRYGDLFPARPFDSAFFAALSMVTAFGSPWASPEELRACGRASLWIFAVDRLVDQVAGSTAEAEALVARCLAAAGDDTARDPAGDGTRAAAAGDAPPVARFLTDLRDELTAAPAFTALRPVWLDRLERTLRAMIREWRWKEAGAPVPLDVYLDGADGCGSSFVNVSHWIRTGDPWTLGHLDDLLVVSDEAQRYLRLLNDLATRDRERGQGDANALAFGAGAAEVITRMNEIRDRCRVLLGPVRAGGPRAAAYLERQIGFNTGFYGLVDYWGELERV
ncbi:terpene synthase [Microbispora cellulosiformans]|uniref:Terpene synthase n=1 Tax=Microbispora cellulosiformans TaxID=2614688 RepID=A0A5J5JTG0_9ACTN|nr:terpene synthase [Microbispora cellulosiformans]KAA9374443.1 terpene synthase [Microbispora cellulosiformans]